MKVCLYWNAGAGEGVSVDEIRSLIRRGGHEVLRVIEPDGELIAVRANGGDRGVAAGGAGTIARAGRALVGGDIPLAILPLGTANNIAGSLSIEGEPESLIDAWNASRVVRIDVGTIEDSRGRDYFVEGVGAGLIPEGINHGQSANTKELIPDVEARLARARRSFRDILDRLAPETYDVMIDGTRIAGESLLVEVLNIATVGPRIRLSPEAHPADNHLSVVIAAEEDRPALARHLDARWDDRSSHAALRSWRTDAVTASGWRQYHVDDEIRDARGGSVSMGIARGALPVLA